MPLKEYPAMSTVLLRLMFTFPISHHHGLGSILYRPEGSPSQSEQTLCFFFIFISSDGTKFDAYYSLRRTTNSADSFDSYQQSLMSRALSHHLKLLQPALTMIFTLSNGPEYQAWSGDQRFKFGLKLQSASFRREEANLHCSP